MKTQVYKRQTCQKKELESIGKIKLSNLIMNYKIPHDYVKKVFKYPKKTLKRKLSKIEIKQKLLKK